MLHVVRTYLFSIFLHTREICSTPRGREKTCEESAVLIPLIYCDQNLKWKTRVGANKAQETKRHQAIAKESSSFDAAFNIVALATDENWARIADERTTWLRNVLHGDIKLKNILSSRRNKRVGAAGWRRSTTSLRERAPLMTRVSEHITLWRENNRDNGENLFREKICRWNKSIN